LGGIEPLTVETLASSSWVPWPNELSEVPLGRSIPACRPATFCQSVLPKVVGLVRRLPSPPAKVLPVSGPEQDCVVPVAAKSHPLGLSAKGRGGDTETYGERGDGHQHEPRSPGAWESTHGAHPFSGAPVAPKTKPMPVTANPPQRRTGWPDYCRTMNSIQPRWLVQEEFSQLGTLGGARTRGVVFFPHSPIRPSSE